MTYNVSGCGLFFFYLCFRYDSLCIDVEVSFSGFPSHIVYYSVLIKGPH